MRKDLLWDLGGVIAHINAMQCRFFLNLAHGLKGNRKGIAFAEMERASPFASLEWERMPLIWNGKERCVVLLLLTILDFLNGMTEK